MTATKTKKWDSSRILSLISIIGITAFTLYEGFRGGSTLSWIKAVTMAAAIFGVINCAMSASGSIWNYFLGVPAVILQGIVALHDGNYGIGIMEFVYLVPMQIAGFVIWMRRGAKLSSDTQEAQVQGRTLSWKARFLVLGGIVLALACLAPLLKLINANAPWLDAAAVIMQVVAQVLMTLAYMEQWIIWMVLNLTYIVLWSVTWYQTSSENAILMIAMWFFYFILSINGYIVWKRISK